MKAVASTVLLAVVLANMLEAATVLERLGSFKRCLSTVGKVVNEFVDASKAYNSYLVYGQLTCGQKMSDNKQTQMELVIEHNGKKTATPVDIDHNGGYSVCVDTAAPFKASLHIQTSCPDGEPKDLEPIQLPATNALMGHQRDVQLASVNVAARRVLVE